MWVYMICALVVFFFIKRQWKSLKIDGYSERYVLVTGCDSGFGNMLVLRLDALGFRVFAGCLTKAGVETLTRHCSDRVHALVMDVTQETSIETCMEEVKRKLPPNKGLWAVVNNAGRVGAFGPTSWHTRQDYDDVLAVNLYGVILVTRACLELVQREKGRIINTSSIIGRFPFLNPSYAVSKVAVEGYSDVLRQELYPTGTSVHLIEPGFFLTPLMDVDDNRKKFQNKLASLPQEVRQQLPGGMEQQFMASLATIRGWASPDTYKVVDAYVHAITAKFPSARYLVGTDANVKFRILMFLPEWISDFVIHATRPGR